MTEKKPKRDSNGKFSKKFTNPDCEPATKGYVKCVARSVVENSKHAHTFDDRHVTFNILLASFVGVVGSILLWCSTLNATSTFYVGINSVSASVFWVFATILAVRLMESNYYTDTCEYTPQFSKAIRKYEPPVCEKKKECE